MNSFHRVALFLLAVPCAAQQAQQTPPPQHIPPGLEVRTFPLQYLKPADAARLVSPFVFGLMTGVFEAGPSVQAITVRGSRDVLARVDSLLKVYDEPPVTLNLKFQILVGSDSAWRDDAIAPEVQTSLRSLFRFAGYQVVAQGAATVSNSKFSITLRAVDDRFLLNGSVGSISRATVGGARGSTVQLDISLGSSDLRPLMSTGLSVPLGETVIVGSAAGLATDMQKGRTLILVVRPEPVNRGPR
jgi:hypothetical protein